jgi:hypothetical protein
MKPSISPRIHNILEELSSIRSMERGKLSEFHRTRPKPGGKGTARLGPYYKLQAWEEGRNRTRYVAAGELAELKRNLANHERFKQLVAELEQAVIERTRRAGAAARGERGVAGEVKKNSAKKRSPKNTASPKASCPKPGGA